MTRTRPQMDRETAAQMRQLAEQMRWAENRDRLLEMTKRVRELSAGRETSAADLDHPLRCRDRELPPNRCFRISPRDLGTAHAASSFARRSLTTT
jgi:hypothetical protein